MNIVAWFPLLPIRVSCILRCKPHLEKLKSWFFVVIGLWLMHGLFFFFPRTRWIGFSWFITCNAVIWWLKSPFLDPDLVGYYLQEEKGRIVVIIAPVGRTTIFHCRYYYRFFFVVICCGWCFFDRRKTKKRAIWNSRPIRVYFVARGNIFTPFVWNPARLRKLSLGSRLHAPPLLPSRFEVIDWAFVAVYQAHAGISRAGRVPWYRPWPFFFLAGSSHRSRLISLWEPRPPRWPWRISAPAPTLPSSETRWAASGRHYSLLGTEMEPRGCGGASGSFLCFFSSFSRALPVWNMQIKKRIKQVPVAFYKATPTALFSESDFPGWSFGEGSWEPGEAGGDERPNRLSEMGI